MSGPGRAGPTAGPAGAVQADADAEAAAAAGSGSSASSCGPPATENGTDEFDVVDDWNDLEQPPGDGWEHVYHNGRRYHRYLQGRYYLPNDPQEQNREDLKHLLMMALTVCLAPWLVYSENQGADFIFWREWTLVVCASPRRCQEDYRHRDGHWYAAPNRPPPRPHN